MAPYVNMWERLLRWGETKIGGEGVDGEKVQELVRWRKLQKLAGEDKVKKEKN